MNSTNRKSPQATQSVERPVVPPVYHAPPPLKAVQPIVANGAANRRPAVAPSVYRPQPVPKVLQQKRSSPGRPVARAPHLPVAPPVYRPEAGKTVQPKAISPLRTPTAANVVQRSVDDDWDMSYSSEDIDSEDQEILLATSPNVLQWRNGVAAGYREGWDEGVDDERQQLPFFQQPTLVQALAMVGPIPGGAIPAAQIVPPGTWVYRVVNEVTEYRTVKPLVIRRVRRWRFESSLGRARTTPQFRGPVKWWHSHRMEASACTATLLSLLRSTMCIQYRSTGSRWDTRGPIWGR